MNLINSTITGFNVIIPPQTSSCFLNSSVIMIILGFILILGQIVAFGPQVYSIIKAGHVEGINLVTYILGATSCISVLYSGIIESWDNLFCCTFIVRRI